MFTGRPVIHFFADGEGVFTDLQGKESIVINLAGSFTVAALPSGMKSGKPSLVIRIDLPDGRVVLQETSVALWHQIDNILRATSFTKSTRQNYQN